MDESEQRLISTSWRTIKFANGAASELEDDIAAEFPLTVRLDGEEFATIVCSPSDLNDMVVGFLASEGVIRRADDIRSMSLDEAGGFAYVELHRPQQAEKELHSKRFIGSCCGKSRQFYFHNDVRTARTATGGPTVPAARCLELMRMLQASSDDFRHTGGVHNAALAGADGPLLAVRSDIGRHNALDKLYGHALRHGVPTREAIVVFSGRLSSEVVLKTAKIGCGLLLSKSAPTDLALRLADDLGITCAGFIRGDAMNVYTHPRRIRCEPDGT